MASAKGNLQQYLQQWFVSWCSVREAIQVSCYVPTSFSFLYILSPSLHHTHTLSLILFLFLWPSIPFPLSQSSVGAMSAASQDGRMGRMDGSERRRREVELPLGFRVVRMALTFHDRLSTNDLACYSRVSFYFPHAK